MSLFQQSHIRTLAMKSTHFSSDSMIFKDSTEQKENKPANPSDGYHLALILPSNPTPTMQPIPLSKSEFAFAIYTSYHDVLTLEQIHEKLDNPTPTVNPYMFEIIVLGYKYQFFKYNVEWTEVYIESQLPF